MEEAKMRHFFKVLVGDFARRLEIPQNFLKHIPNEERRNSDTPVAASAKVILKNPEGQTWVVELEGTDDSAFLTTGWSKFVEDHSLKEYEFLVFRYDGNMHFMVLVFDMTACEKAIWSSGSGLQAIDSLRRKVPCDMLPSRKNEHTGDILTEAETVNNLKLTRAQVKIPDQSDIGKVNLQRSTQGDEHISSQSFPEIHEAGGLKELLQAESSLKEPMEDDKAKAISQVMRRLHVDKVTIDLFCATLSLHKWNVDAAAKDFDVCRGMPQKQNQFLKQKLVLQFDFVKRQLRHFFPPDDDSPAPEPPEIPKSRQSDCEEPNLSEQPQEHDWLFVKRRRADDYELCGLSQEQKRRIGRLKHGSPRTPQTPRRSPRLANLRNAQDSPKNVLKETSQVLEQSPASPTEQAKDKTVCGEQTSLLCKEPHDVLEEVHEQRKGSSSQDHRKLKPSCGEVGLSEEPQLKPAHDEMGLNEEPQHNQEVEDKMNTDNKGTSSEERTEKNAAKTSKSYMSRCFIESSPPNSEVITSSTINGLSFTWKPSEHVNPLEKILHDIQQDNFMMTVSHIQEIIRSHPSDLLTAGVIEAIVQKEILKGDSCLEDRDAQRIVNALLEHAKKIKEMQNFNMEMRKEEFTMKLQDQLKWQLKELEGAYTSLELAYKKATSDVTVAFSTLREHKKNLHALQDDIMNLRQSLEVKEYKMQKLVCQIAELESVVQKSIKEKVTVQMALKSYQQTLDEVKERLASTEAGSLDVEVLVKVEMEDMRKEIELSRGSLLDINIKK